MNNKMTVLFRKLTIKHLLYLCFCVYIYSYISYNHPHHGILPVEMLQRFLLPLSQANNPLQNEQDSYLYIPPFPPP